MHKFFKVFLATILTIFSIPFGGISAFAEDKTYDDIEDGEYSIKLELLTKGTEDTSIADQYVSEEAALNIKDGKAELVIEIPKMEGFEFKEFEIEGYKYDKTETEDNDYYHFKLDEVKQKLKSVVTYSVNIPPYMVFDHEDLGMDIQLVGLDKLPVVEEEEVDAKELNYTVDVSAMERYMESVKLVEAEGKNEVTFRFNSQEFIDKFEIVQSDTYVTTEDVVVDGDFVDYTFEIADLSETLAAKITIDAMGREMVHEFNIDFTDYKEGKEETEEPAKSEEKEIELGQEEDVESNDIITIKGSQGTQVTMPEDLPEDVKLTVTSTENEDENQGDLEVAGDVYEFNFTNLEDYEGSFELVMGYDTSDFDSDQVDIYYYDEDQKKWIPQEGTAKDGKITVKVNHFSTYGVFAQEKPEEPAEEEDDEEVPEADKTYEIDYTILNENGKDKSVADEFFIKPGILLEKDNKTYIHMTVESAEMVKALSNKYGDYVLVDEKDGSKTMQLRVDNDLSDMELDMHIVVPSMPGFPGYDSEHKALLTFDKDSKKEIKEGTPIPDPKEDPKEDPKKEPKEDPKDDPKEKSLTPDKAYEIMYTILHEDGNAPSVADGFFQKPGILLEYDGKTYFQMTVESAEMVKSLSNKYGEYILVSNNDDGTVTIQLRVDNDLSDMKLDMHIVVPAGAIPGFPGYDEKHGAILTFDKDSKKEISVEGLEVAASGDKNNENGPYSEKATPSKPGLGENGDDDDNGKPSPDKPENPKTGDTTAFLLYTLLLFASALPLIIQIRRRFGKA